MNFAQYVTELRDRIRRKYSCEAVHLRSDGVTLSVEETVLWEGNVELFALLDCVHGSQCYGWAVAGREGEGREYVVMLHKPPVDSAQRAVQAWMRGK